MKSDITVLTIFVISGFFIVTSIGEYIGINTIFIKRNEKEYFIERAIDDKKEIYIAKWKVYVLTLILMIVAIDRYRNLVNAALAYSKGKEIDGIMSMMSVARQAFVSSNRSLVLGNVFFNQLVYICEISAYIFVFIFLYNMINCKQRRWYMLFPLIPDFIIRFITTSRTAYLILLIAIIICYFCIVMKLHKFHIPTKLILAVGIFAIIFILYGRIRNNAQSIPLVSYIQMYTCSSIYGLDHLLKEGWEQVPYFGFNTMQHIYDLLGVEREIVRKWSEMIMFSKSNSIQANLYTSLSFPIIDFGILGCFLLRLISAIITTKVLAGFLYNNCSEYSFYISIYFAVVSVYCYFYSATGDVFSDYFFNPSLMIRYLVYSWVFVKCYLRPEIREGKKIE